MDLGVVQRHLENLRIVFLFHFILMSWAMFSGWAPQGYLFYNAFFLFTLLWGLHSKESDEPIIMGLYINCLAVIFDVLVIFFYHPPLLFYHFFSVLAALLNLLLRFFSIVSLCKLCESRNGTIPPFLNNLLGAAIDREQQTYEDIDRSVPHQSVPQTEVGVEPKSTSKPNPKANPKPEKPKSRSSSRSEKARDDICPE